MPALLALRQERRRLCNACRHCEADLSVRCRRGLTARDYAAGAGHAAGLRLLDHPLTHVAAA